MATFCSTYQVFKFSSPKANSSLGDGDGCCPGDLGFYAPITTPFGYYGPTWLADGTVNAGFNFSLWSYGRGQEEPPIEQLSHLLAIGNRDATFGGFGHEEQASRFVTGIHSLVIKVNDKY
jgi:hypothetical protein